MAEKCPACGSKVTEFIDSNNDGDGEYHLCMNCDYEFELMYASTDSVPDSPNDFIFMGDY